MIFVKIRFLHFEKDSFSFANFCSGVRVSFSVSFISRPSSLVLIIPVLSLKYESLFTFCFKIVSKTFSIFSKIAVVFLSSNSRAFSISSFCVSLVKSPYKSPSISKCQSVFLGTF